MFVSLVRVSRNKYGFSRLLNRMHISSGEAGTAPCVKGRIPTGWGHGLGGLTLLVARRQRLFSFKRNVVKHGGESVPAGP